MEGGDGSGANGMGAAPSAPDRNERPLGGAAERPIGSSRPTTASNGGDGGLAFGDHVPTTREIESGAVVVQEVQAVKDTDSVATADLPPLNNVDEDLKFVIDNVKTRNWADRFDILHLARKFVKFSPHSLDEHLEQVGILLIESLKNPRSSLIRESLQLATDLFACAGLKGVIKSTEKFPWPKLVPAILLKAMNDKKFLATEGLHALKAFVEGWADSYRLFLGETDNRNAKIAAIALQTVADCVVHLGEALKDMEPVGPEAAPLQPLVTAAVKAMLKGKLAGTRDHGKSCLDSAIQASGGWAAFETLYGPKISKPDMKQVKAIFKVAEPAQEEECTSPSKPEAATEEASPSALGDWAFPAAETPVEGGLSREEALSVGNANNYSTPKSVSMVVPVEIKPEDINPPVPEAAPVVMEAAVLTAAGMKSTTPRSRRSSDAEVMSEF